MAGTVYKCTDHHGHVSYQDTPCSRRQQQEKIHLSDAPPPPASTAPVPAAPPVPAPTPEPGPSPEATRPPPQVYQCVRATDGDTYLSRQGRPPAYLAPLRMLAIRQPLADVYGSQQGTGVGMSAPELANKPTSRTIGGYLTPVRDACRALSPRAGCEALRRKHDANEEAIRKAFKSDRGPLLEKRRHWREWMQGCQGA